MAAVDKAVAECNRANIAVDVLVGTPSGRAYGGPSDAYARAIATGTSGEVIPISDDLPERLADLVRQQDEAYLIGYVPPNAPEGSCHTLRVKVDIRGVETRARQEYCTEKRPDVVSGRIAGAALAARTAGNSGALAPTMQLPYFYTGTNRAVVHVTLQVVPAGMKFTKDQGTLHGQIALVGTATRADGATAGRFADTVKVDMPDQKQADAFVKAPWNYEHYFTLASGKYNFDMAVGTGDNSAGKVDAPLEIAPWAAGSFGISGIALSREVHRVDGSADSASGGPALEGRAPLMAQGVRVVPSPSVRFARGEHVYFYTEIYDPSLNAATAAASLDIQYRVIDRQSGQVKEDSGMVSVANYVRPGNTVVPVATTLPVADLAAGEYRLEISAAHAGAPEAVTKAVDFELN
jgi:hypothetical protein